MSYLITVYLFFHHSCKKKIESLFEEIGLAYSTFRLSILLYVFRFLFALWVSVYFAFASFSRRGV